MPPSHILHLISPTLVVHLRCKTQADLTPWPELMRVMKSGSVDKCRRTPCVHTFTPPKGRRGKMLKCVVATGSRGLFSTISMCPSWGEQESNSEVCPKDNISHFMACLSLCLHKLYNGAHKMCILLEGTDFLTVGTYGCNSVIFISFIFIYSATQLKMIFDGDAIIVTFWNYTIKNIQTFCLATLTSYTTHAKVKSFECIYVIQSATCH